MGEENQTDRGGDVGIETTVRRNCRKQLGHAVIDLGKWQHTEQMKTGQRRPGPYCEAEVETSIFPRSLKLT